MPYKRPKVNLFHGLTLKDIMIFKWSNVKEVVALYNVYLFISNNYLKGVLYGLVSFLCAMDIFILEKTISWYATRVSSVPVVG